MNLALPDIGGRIPASVQTLAAYAAALAIVWWVARSLSLGQMLHDLANARLTVFVPVCLASVAVWIVGDTYLYARLFSYFHLPTNFREMLPAVALHEFLQATNKIAAGTSVVVFANRRLGVNWLAAGCTVAFLGFIDLQVLLAMALVASLFAPASIPGISWPFLAAPLAVSLLFAGFWLLGRPRSGLAQYIYDRSSFEAFREARMFHYLILAAMRAALFALQGIILDLKMLSFGINAGIARTMAAMPAVLIAGAIPFLPAGLGARQAAIVTIFKGVGSESSLLAMALAHYGLSTIARLVIGICLTGVIARQVRNPQVDRPAA